MKKITTLIIAVLTFVPLMGQTIVMEEDGGVYKVPCLVNGAKMKFIFDTGASTISLSMSMAEYLLDNDYILTSDFIKTGQSIIADGSIVDHMEINLRDLEISGNHLYNVPAVVVSSQNAPLLLGMSAIQKLGTVELNGNVLTINHGDGVVNDDRVNELVARIKTYDDGQRYEKEKECWEELCSITKLSDLQLFEYASCCEMGGYSDDDLNILEEIMDYNTLLDLVDYNIYPMIAHIYYANDKYRDAYSYFQKAIDRYADEGDTENVAKYCAILAEAYYINKYYSNAAEYFRKASICYYLINSEFYNYDNEDYYIDYYLRDVMGELKNNEQSYRTNDIDTFFFKYYESSYLAGSTSWKEFKRIVLKLYRNKNTAAMEYKRENNIETTGEWIWDHW